MRHTLNLAILALLGGMALSSCTSDLENKAGVPELSQEGARIISAAFAPVTRTQLGGEEGLTPEFCEGDKIMLSNGTDLAEEVTVHLSGGKAWFSTTLDGDLSAVYPSSHALLNEEGTRIENTIIPREQSGRFEDANLMYAEIESSSNTATFEVAASLLKITPPEGTKHLTITSLRTMSDGVRKGRREPIALDGENYYDFVTINSTEALGTCYVILMNTANLSDLSFDTGSALKGIPTKDITKDQLQYGTMYTIDEKNWHPYIEIQGKKFATMNIGADSPTSTGPYFAWGDVAGQKPSSGTFSASFDWTHAPFNNGSSAFEKTYFNSVKDTECPDGILILKNDAAYVNWGGAWVMPDASDIEALLRITGTTADDIDEDGVLTIRGTELKFPASGFGSNTGLYRTGEGDYWTRELNPDDAGQAKDFSFGFNMTDGEPAVSNGDRKDGLQIRPVAGAWN